MMTRAEAKKLVDKLLKSYDRGDTDTIYWQIIAALTTEPNQPEGPGFYDLTVRVEVREGPCRPIMKIASLPICYPDDITGHWQKVGK